MVFIPKSGQIIPPTNNATAFVPKSGQFVPTSGQVVPPVQPEVPNAAGFTPSQVRARIEARKAEAERTGKSLEQINFESLSAEKQAELQPGRDQANWNQGFLAQAGGFAGDFGRNLGTAGTGAIEGAVKGGAGIVATGADVGGWLGEKATGGLIKAPEQGAGQFMRDAGNYVGGAIGQTGQDLFQGADMARQGGNLSGQILSMAAPMSWAAKAEKGIKGFKMLENAPKAVKALRGLLGIGAESAISTAGATAATEGRMPTLEELKAGGAIDFALRGLGGGLGKVAKGSYDKLLGLSRGQKGKMAEKGLDLAQALADKKYVGMTRTSIANKIQKDVGKLSDKLDGLIRKAEGGDTKALAKLGETSGFTADDLLKNVSVEGVFKSPKLKPKFGELKTVKKQIGNAIDEFRKTVGKNTMTLSDIQAFKKNLGNSLSSFYSKTGDAKATAREIVNDILRKNAKEIIEVNIKEAKKLNQLMAPLIEAKNVLKKKGDYSGKLTDYLIGGAVGGGSLAQGQSPTDALKNVLLVGFLKKAGSSPLGRSMLGATESSLGKVLTAQPTRQAVKSNSIIQNEEFRAK